MITSRPSILPLVLAAVLAVPSLLLTSQASAQDLCDDNGALMVAARQAQAEQVKEIEEHAQNVFGPMALSPSWLTDAQSALAQCVAEKFEGWQSSTGHALFDQYANKAIEKGIDRACEEQRRRVAEYTAKAKGYVSRIPGYEHIGSIQDAFIFDGTGGMSYTDILRGIRDAIPGGSNLTYDELLRRVREKIPGGDRLTNDQLIDLFQNGQVPDGVIDYEDLIGRVRDRISDRIGGGNSGGGNSGGGNQNPSPQPPPGNYGPSIPGVGPGNPQPGVGPGNPQPGGRVDPPSGGIPGILP